VDLLGLMFYRKNLGIEKRVIQGTVIGKSKREEIHGNGSADIQEVFNEVIPFLIVQLSDKTVSVDITELQFESIEVGESISVIREVSILERKRLYFICAFSRKSLFYTSHQEIYYL